jgi:hypothetical protein
MTVLCVTECDILRRVGQFVLCTYNNVITRPIIYKIMELAITKTEVIRRGTTIALIDSSSESFLREIFFSGYACICNINMCNYTQRNAI